MSGDAVCNLEAFMFCPFCGNKITKSEIHWIIYEKMDGQQYDASFVYLGGEFKYLQFRLECESHKANSAEIQIGPNGKVCPAMMEGGAFFLNIYPDGTCYAQYF